MAHMAHMIFHIVSEHGHGASDRELTPNQEERVVDELKKSYSTPQLAVENFVLEAHIAAGNCSQTVTPDKPFDLGDGEMILFSNGGTCNVTLDQVDSLNLYFCYQTVSDANKIFQS